MRAAVLDAWTPLRRAGAPEPVEERPGRQPRRPRHRTPRRRRGPGPRPPSAAPGRRRRRGANSSRVRERLDDTLQLTARLTPPPAAPPRPAPGRPLTTVGELARAGALHLRTGAGAGSGTAPVLTEHDVLAGAAPSGRPPTGRAPEDEPLLLEPGDVVVPVLGGGAVARVVDDATAGAALGRNLQLLRPDPAALDPWFLAGFLRGTANNRQASSYASTATRLDARRLQLPRLPLAEQRRYGEQFRALAAFEDALRYGGPARRATGAGACTTGSRTAP